MKNQNYQFDWEEFSRLDPLWAVLTLEGKKHRKWNDGHFFWIGENEIQNFLTRIKSLNIAFDEALDFGCGVGRLTRALGKHFGKVYGIDISENMISMAKKFHQNNKNLIFLQNTRDDLSCFKDNKFNLIYSNFTLGHIPDQNIIKNYLSEFLRISKPGGLIFFHLPNKLLYNKLRLFILKVRGQIYHFLVRIGVPRNFCYRYLNLAPRMEANYLPTTEIKKLFAQGANILWIKDESSNNPKYLIQKQAL